MIGEFEVGAFIAIYVLENAGCHHVNESHWDEIDAAFHNWIERRIDRVLSLTSCHGSDLLIPASRISEVLRSTPESRELNRVRDAAMGAENGFQES